MRKLLFVCVTLALLVSNAEANVSGWNPDTGTYNVDPSGSILKSEKESKLLRFKDKFYVNFDEIDSNDDSFHVHIGENLWIETNCIHRDPTGFYTYESDIFTIDGAYEKKWRCPYCNTYWPMGVACKNPDCPSKFKG